MGKKKEILCSHDGGTCHHSCEAPYCFREDRGLTLSKPDKFYRENPNALIFRNAIVICAADMSRQLEMKGKMRLDRDDSKMSIIEAGGIVTEHETGTVFDWGREATMFVKERWSDEEAVLAARALERIIKDEERK